MAPPLITGRLSDARRETIRRCKKIGSLAGATRTCGGTVADCRILEALAPRELDAPRAVRTA